MTSAPRVERVDDLVVDSQGLDPPTHKWLQAAREAADTDGIRENAYAERLQMCISCCTLMCMFPMVPNMYRVSHSRYVSERVSPSYSTTGQTTGRSPRARGHPHPPWRAVHRSFLTSVVILCM